MQSCVAVCYGRRLVAEATDKRRLRPGVVQSCETVQRLAEASVCLLPLCLVAGRISPTATHGHIFSTTVGIAYRDVTSQVRLYDVQSKRVSFCMPLTGRRAVLS